MGDDVKLSITSRLTWTTALLTLVVFSISAAVLYSIVAKGIRDDAIRSADEAVRGLAFNAVHQWEALIDRGGEAQLRVIGLDAPHWAVVRGSGEVLTGRGACLDSTAFTHVGDSHLQAHSGEKFRVASVPMFDSPPETFGGLPDQVQEIVRQESPGGAFLRAKREVHRGRAVIEVTLLRDGGIDELEFSQDGELIETDRKKLLQEVPADLQRLITADVPLEDIAFAGWQPYHGQLIAVITGVDGTGARREIAISRLGERFELDEDGRIVRPAGPSRLWVVTAVRAQDEIVATRRSLIAVVAAFAILWVLGVVGSWWVTRQAMSPVQRIVSTLEAIEVSNLDARLPVDGAEDELNGIAVAINRTLDRIESGYTREREFTGDASHELRGPVAKILADIDIALSKERSSDEYRETLMRCRNYALGIRSLIESLLWLARLDARRGDLHARDFDLTEVATDVIRVLPAERASRVRLDLSREESVVTAYGDPDLVRVMLHNLLHNSLRYSPADTPVDLQLSTHNGTTAVTVSDRGCGIPDDQIEQVFSRFYRVDRARSRETGGFGLGLAIVNEIAIAHGTEVAMTNLPSGGLRASFSLPRHNVAESSADRPE